MNIQKYTSWNKSLHIEVRRTKHFSALAAFGLRGIMASWGVAIAEPQRHQLAKASLTDLGIEAFIPMVEKIVVTHGRQARKLYPLLGRYVLFLLDDAWARVCSLRGITGLLLTADNQPAVASSSSVEALRALCRIDDVYADPEAMQSIGIVLTYGQKVRPRSGPLAAHVGTYEGSISRKKCTASFVLFGHEQLITFRKGDLIAA